MNEQPIAIHYRPYWCINEASYTGNAKIQLLVRVIDLCRSEELMEKSNTCLNFGIAISKYNTMKNTSLGGVFFYI